MAYGRSYRLDRDLWRPVRPRGVVQRALIKLSSAPLLSHAFLACLLHRLRTRGLRLVGNDRLRREGLSWLPDGDFRGASR